MFSGKITCDHFGIGDNLKNYLGMMNEKKQ